MVNRDDDSFDDHVFDDDVGRCRPLGELQRLTASSGCFAWTSVVD